MKDLVPEILREDILKNLEEQNKITYFNYLGNLNKFSGVSEAHILKMLQGKNHVLVNKHLYVKHGNFDYQIHLRNWTETNEGKKYKPLLENICSNE